MTRVIKKKYFCFHYQMINLSCHPKSQKVHSDTVLKIVIISLPYETSPPRKDKPLRLKDFNSAI